MCECTFAGGSGPQRSGLGAFAQRARPGLGGAHLRVLVGVGSHGVLGGGGAAGGGGGPWPGTLWSPEMRSQSDAL